MQAIYRPKPGSPAEEYAPWACNLYKGCAHGCVYCYAPAATWQNTPEKRAAFHGRPQPREGVLEALERDACKLSQKGERGPVLLCFTCDPYQPLERDHRLTRTALRILRAHGLRPKILTKAGPAARRDLGLLSAAGGSFGVSLTSLSEQARSSWEPGADAGGLARVDNLRAAMGFKVATWASFEPVITPQWTVNAIREAAAYCNLIAVGKLNHMAPPKPIHWPSFRRQVAALLESLGFTRVDKSRMQAGPFLGCRHYYIKQDLEHAR